MSDYKVIKDCGLLKKGDLLFWNGMEEAYVNNNEIWWKEDGENVQYDLMSLKAKKNFYKTTKYFIQELATQI